MSNHELTGEPYLGITMHGRWFHHKPFAKYLPDWFYEVEHVDDKGRRWWTPRKTTTALPHALYRLHKKAQPRLCKIGIHDPADIREIDASVFRAECMECHQLVKPHRPHPADPEEAKRWEEQNERGRKLSKAIDDYEAGVGPCMWCSYPNGEHEDSCWETI